MMGIGLYGLLIWVLSVLCSICVSLEFDPVDNYLIDCGSPKNTRVGDRVFVADNFTSNILSTLHDVSVNTISKSNLSTFDSSLFQTARILTGTSQYTFSIKKHGWHWVRLYFFPFADEKYNLSNAKFSVSAQNFTLLRDFQPENGSVVKEYSLNITSNSLVLTFVASANSFAFLNALEVFNLPDELIPSGGKIIDPPGGNQNLLTRALETVARVNMGNSTVSPQNDTLWRHWVSDETHLIPSILVAFVSNVGAVNYTGVPTQNIAPPEVYGTATRLNLDKRADNIANVTWFFDVDPGFEYLVRFHFCDIVNSSDTKLEPFNVYMNSQLVASDLDLSNLTSNIFGVPYYKDVVTGLSTSQLINISVGPSELESSLPDGILNGLEIMKISNSRDSLDAVDPHIQLSTSSSKMKVWVILGLAIGVLFIALILTLIVFLLCRRRRRLVHVGHSTQDNFAMNGGGNAQTTESKYSNGTSMISSSKIGYRFSLAVIQEATNNFSESYVVGVGGFGKVYKGVLRDETKVAVKRGVSQSRQGLAEFRTEIEMLSQFRHRHLLSLVGYCDEQNEMIIVYEYMENGTLKNHLYGSNLPSLSWRQRLEISIGSARGLHYLHTGSAKAIIHRDVKSANILLDENLMAKVADFGLSKTGPEIDETHVSTAVKGSFGYLDPEYLIRQQLTEKSDVYSFGVVLLEIICGRPVIDPSLTREMVNLVEWAMKWQKRGELEKIVDPHLVGKVKLESLRKFGETVEKCLAERGADRPTMGDVLWSLESALQLQGDDGRPPLNGELSNNHLETSVSTTQFSVGSMGDLAGVSMNRVFSQMVKAEMR
ncbi:probable receptor-like protein kinase At5g59700 [Cornus florida]|uniref:probable receptor-like protein kinase At5g59700 n=1 Tax=Cornus florida TaxID=4283 RepID=UPI00289DD2AB|nr:probable receptor-like protein kinase At5g59700 [Cornus florida]